MPIMSSKDEKPHHQRQMAKKRKENLTPLFQIYNQQHANSLTVPVKRAKLTGQSFL